MNAYLTNWQTTFGGLLTAAIGAASLFGVKIGAAPIDPTTALGMIVGGITIMQAKQQNVTGTGDNAKAK